MNKKSIVEIFWNNVDWHRKNKGLKWHELVGTNATTAKSKRSNPTLRTVEVIADILEIDDYAILFES